MIHKEGTPTIILSLTFIAVLNVAIQAAGGNDIVKWMKSPKASVLIKYLQNTAIGKRRPDPYTPTPHKKSLNAQCMDCLLHRTAYQSKTAITEKKDVCFVRTARLCVIPARNNQNILFLSVCLRRRKNVARTKNETRISPISVLINKGKSNNV